MHGLGGSAVGTWTHPSTGGFWPAWLTEDDNFKAVRILTFGYEAFPQSALGIADIANQLLISLDVFHFQHPSNVLSHSNMSHTT